MGAFSIVLVYTHGLKLAGNKAFLVQKWLKYVVFVQKFVRTGHGAGMALIEKNAIKSSTIIEIRLRGQLL